MRHQFAFCTLHIVKARTKPKQANSIPNKIINITENLI